MPAPLRARNGAVTTKAEAVEGTFEAPNLTTDGVLVESPAINFSPQNTETDEVNGSLDGEGPIPGGMQCEVSFRMYLKGSGTPGLEPEGGKVLEACGLKKTAFTASITGVTFAITGGNTIADSANQLAAATIGSPIALIIAGELIGEFIVTASAAASITVQKPDGTAAGLTNAVAGPAFDIRIGVAAVLATAGSTTGFTAQAPWAAVLQQYRGAPVWLSTNPVTPYLTALDDYSIARVAKIIETLGATLSVTTRVGIPSFVSYQPHSGVIPSNSLEVYFDGTRYRFAGTRGDASLTFNTAGASWADIRMTGKFVSKADAAVPQPTYNPTRPGSFRESRFTVNRTPAAIRSVTLNLNNNLVYPPNPNDVEGFDAGQIMSRRLSGTMDPQATFVATRDLMTDFRLGNRQPIYARVSGGPGKIVGNRVGLAIPTAQYETYQPTNDQGMLRDQVGFFCANRDDGARLTFF